VVRYCFVSLYGLAILSGFAMLLIVSLCSPAGIFPRLSFFALATSCSDCCGSGATLAFHMIRVLQCMRGAVARLDSIRYLCNAAVLRVSPMQRVKLF
jgi:hypothetical protein